MITKHFIRNKDEFHNKRDTYWQSTAYHTYYVRRPDQFPCVAIEISEPQGQLGTVSTIEDFVYLTDFEA